MIYRNALGNISENVSFQTVSNYYIITATMVSTVTTISWAVNIDSDVK